MRKADADWAAAARSISVDAWMAFYAADAVVLLPNDQLASDKELVRNSVSHLLALPHLSVAWSPIKIAVARSGEQALLIEAYELRFGDSRGGRYQIEADASRSGESKRTAFGNASSIPGPWTSPLRRRRLHHRQVRQAPYRLLAPPRRLRNQRHHRRL